MSSALEAGFTQIIMRDEDSGLRRLGRFDAILIKGSDLFLDNKMIGTILKITNPGDLKKASNYRDKIDNLIISAKDWKVIPLENLIAEFQGSHTKLMAAASTPEELKLFSETMEVGADGIVIEPKDAMAIKGFLSETSKGAGKDRR